MQGETGKVSSHGNPQASKSRFTRELSSGTDNEKEKHDETIDDKLSKDNQLPVVRRIAIPHQGREKQIC